MTALGPWDWSSGHPVRRWLTSPRTRAVRVTWRHWPGDPPYGRPPTIHWFVDRWAPTGQSRRTWAFTTSTTNALARALARVDRRLGFPLDTKQPLRYTMGEGNMKIPLTAYADLYGLSPINALWQAADLDLTATCFRTPPAPPETLALRTAADIQRAQDVAREDPSLIEIVCVVNTTQRYHIVLDPLDATRLVGAANKAFRTVIAAGALWVDNNGAIVHGVLTAGCGTADELPGIYAQDFQTASVRSLVDDPPPAVIATLDRAWRKVPA